MSQILMVIAMSVLLSWGPTFIPVVVSLVHAVIGVVRNASGAKVRLRRPVPSPA